MNEPVSFEQLEFKKLSPSPEEVHKLTLLFSDCFKSMNPIWKKLNIPPNEIYEYMKDRIVYASQVGYLYVMILPTTGEFIMAAFLLPLKAYICKNSLGTNLNFKWC